MAEAEKHQIRKWLGKRSSYEYLKSKGALNGWTEYTVVEESDVDGAAAIWNYSGATVYMGENPISVPTGQLLPVTDIKDFAPAAEKQAPYQRYLVGEEGDDYKVVEYLPQKTAEGYTLVMSEIPFDGSYGVRVKSKGYKNYIYLPDEKRVVTYDDVDCGEF